jgi:signal transduction histidine kinase
MGLAISRSLIEENGGQLWVDPNEGPDLTLPFALCTKRLFVYLIGISD